MRGTRALDQVYDRLAPWERFQLTLAAQARDDDRELQQLAQTCPRKPCHVCEPDFLEPLELALELGHAFAAEILPLAGRLAVAQAATELADAHFRILVDTVEFADPCAPASPDFRREVCDAIDEIAARHIGCFEHIQETLIDTGATAAHGFAEFCTDELGVEAHILLGAFARIALPAFELFVAHAADTEAAAGYAAALRGAWRFRLGQQPDPTPVPRRT